MNFLILCIILQSVLVQSDSVCDKCACGYDSKTRHDYQGQIVDCSQQRHILEDNYTLPAIVKTLDLSANNINRITKTSLLNSNTLTKLLLNRNSLTELKNNVFELPELKRLDLSDNELEFLDKEVFVNMKKLEYLNIANNRFTTFEKLTFHPLSELKEAILDNNKLGPSLKHSNLFDRNGFGLTNKIESLSIRGISLNDVPDNFFVDAYAIRKLTISNNNVSDIFEIPYTLEYLDISDNPITDLETEDFNDLPALRVLKLNNLSIKEVPELLFSTLKGLKVLELERNVNMARFSALAFGREVLEDADDFVLESVSFKNSRLVSLSDQLLEPFGQLVKLDLGGNPWICDCKLVWIKKLQIPKSLLDNVRCARPVSLSNQRIYDLKENYFYCAIDKHYKGLTIAGISFFVSLAVIAIWLTFIIPRYNSRGKYMSAIADPNNAYAILPMQATGLHT